MAGRLTRRSRILQTGYRPRRGPGPSGGPKGCPMVRLRILAGLFIVGWLAGCGSPRATTPAPAPVPVTVALVVPTVLTPVATVPVTEGSTVSPVTSPPATSSPATHPAVTAPPATHPAATTPPATEPVTTSPPASGCHPLTNGGKCYEPGEFCRNTDHGVSGVAGDGEHITCRDNNGWRWEPS